jgi:peptide-methionine (S)-S-oxide reductase
MSLGSTIATAQSLPAKTTAIFAGGCFWCMEPPYDKLDGVSSTTSGFIGGHLENPTYKQVTTGTTGHAEAVRVIYDPAKVSYAQLLEVFWRNIDPLDAGGQFCDRGSPYRSGIFYLSEAQKIAAEASLKKLEASGRFDQPIVTELTAATTFYPAEDYHQNYYQRNPLRYRYYRSGCGRDKRLNELWGD